MGVKVDDMEVVMVMVVEQVVVVMEEVVSVMEKKEAMLEVVTPRFAES